jgi:hypothetical protein
MPISCSALAHRATHARPRLPRLAVEGCQREAVKAASYKHIRVKESPDSSMEIPKTIAARTAQNNTSARARRLR